MLASHNRRRVAGTALHRQIRHCLSSACAQYYQMSFVYGLATGGLIFMDNSLTVYCSWMFTDCLLFTDCSLVVCCLLFITYNSMFTDCSLATFCLLAFHLLSTVCFTVGCLKHNQLPLTVNKTLPKITICLLHPSLPPFSSTSTLTRSGSST